METPKITTLAELKKPNPMTLHLGDLRKLLAQHPDLPDDVPVLCQRIEDEYFTEKGGWPVVLLPWESRPYNPDTDADRLAEMEKERIPGTYKIIERDGQTFISERTQYMDACGAYLAKDDEGNEALCLHSHY
jgi:hypothetical protein